MEVGGSAACVWEDGTSVGVHGLHVEMSWEVEAVGFMSERGEIRPLCLHGDHEKSMEREMRETVGC